MFNNYQSWKLLQNQKNKKRPRFHKDAVWWYFSAQGYTKWLGTFVSVFVTLISWCVCMFFFSAPYNYVIILLCYFHGVSLNVAVFFVFFFSPRRVKCTRCIMQNNSTESLELWTQFCRHPNLKDRETTTWFCGTCSACCGDYFGGRGHCVEMIVGEEKNKASSGTDPTLHF